MFNFCTPKEDYVSCDTCKCLLKKKHAQSILVRNRRRFMNTDYLYTTNLYYCKSDEKAFENAMIDYDGNMRMYSTLEVYEDGTPVGYKKSDNKK